MEKQQSVFETLNSVNCNEHTEKKNGLTYLSWAWAWAEVKKRYPGAFYTIYENPINGMPYFNDGFTCMVKTGVTIEGQEHIEYLPVMDFRNASIPVDKVTSFDVNKAIQRSLTKACARHGLGLYIYAGEDLPETAEDEVATPAPTNNAVQARKSARKATPKPAPAPAPAQPYTPANEELYWNLINAYANGNRCKSGKDCRTYWMELTHPTAEALAKFDHDVENYCIAHNITLSNF